MVLVGPDQVRVDGLADILDVVEFYEPSCSVITVRDGSVPAAQSLTAEWR
jgi:hypothetical protein